MIHVPVLLEEVIEYLDLAPGKHFLDATLDGGGHTRAIKERFPDVQILGIEWDPEEFAEFRKNNPELAETIITVNDSYANLSAIVESNHFKPDAILFDLGVSSWHYEASKRGFSFQKNEPLDMRFNPQTQPLSASELVNTWGKDELERILVEYGEEQFASDIAEAIVVSRKAKPILKTEDLVEVVKGSVPKWYTHRRIHPATKTFQALRIAVNGELENVRNGVESALDVLQPGGRVAVISFHGLEDKIVREIFKKRTAEGDIKWVKRSTIRPKWAEVERNPRARSAKMKVVEKL